MSLKQITPEKKIYDKIDELKFLNDEIISIKNKVSEIVLLMELAFSESCEECGIGQENIYNIRNYLNDSFSKIDSLTDAITEMAKKLHPSNSFLNKDYQ